MNLRHKFGVLALIYVLSLSANLVMSGWCIVVYFQSAFVEFQSSFVRQAELEQLRSLVRRLQDDASERRGSAITEIASGVSRLREQAAKNEDASLWSAAVDMLKTADQQPDGVDWRLLHHQLDLIRSDITRARHASIEQAGRTQQKVVYILIFNAACGAVLCVVGLFLVRRWVLVPIAQLREAAREFSQGNLDYRIKPQRADELGHLADEVNQMAATIVEMQEKLLAQERLAAAGEIVTRLAHNIRNPLAGIRGLAEATAHDSNLSGRARENQNRIIESVDRFEKWLRDLQQSVSPLRLDVRPIPVLSVVENVRVALAPLAAKRDVRIETRVEPKNVRARIDSFHFEQALVALVTNAVQASQPGMTVRIDVDHESGKPGRWRVAVSDEGQGVDASVRNRIFEPYFTTKPGGNGVGLSSAQKVIQIHGGRLELESTPGQGSVFVALMPGLVSDSN